MTPRSSYEQTKTWRDANPDAVAVQRRRAKAKTRALSMLGRIHDRELDELVAFCEREMEEEA